MLKKIKPYVVSVLIALAVGALSAFFTRNSMDIYGSITKPPLAPPSWLFPVAWGILYVLMGISAAIIYINRKKAPEAARKGLGVYAVSLFVNFLWSIIFFNYHAFLFSFIWLCLLWLLVLKTIIEYRKVSLVGAYLQLPYLLWVTFAGYLNLMIYLLNR